MEPRPVAALPAPKLLGSISPSRFTAVEACILREACGTGKKSNLLPGYPKSFLGSVYHKMVELGAKGQLSCERSKLEKVWNALVADAETRVSQNPLESHLSPFKKSCDEYFLIRARAIRDAVKLASAAGSPRLKTVPPASGLGHEIYVSSKDGIVKGKIDSVVLNEGVLTISDYKTGSVLLDDAGVTKVKPEYETQLKLYAALYNETYGRWPDRLLLLNHRGKNAEVTFDREQCDHLLERTKEVFRNTNKRIKAALEEGNPAALASPSQDACRYCVLRPGCKSYCEARRTQPDAQWPHDIWGKVENKTGPSSGLWALSLCEASVPNGKAVIRRLSAGSRHSLYHNIVLGETVAAFNLRKESNSETYTESAITFIYLCK